MLSNNLKSFHNYALLPQAANSEKVYELANISASVFCRSLYCKPVSIYWKLSGCVKNFSYDKVQVFEAWKVLYSLESFFKAFHVWIGNLYTFNPSTRTSLQKSTHSLVESHFLYLFCHFQEWHGLLSSSFAAILLLSSSTLVAIVLIIQSELEMETSAIHASASRLAAPRKSSLKKTSIKTNTTTTTLPSSESSQTVTEPSTDQNHSPSNSIRKQQKPVMKTANLSSTNRGVKSAICLSWLLPILVAMCIPMIHQIIGPRSIEWWLELTSPDFIIFAITESLLLFLFVLLFMTLLKHLIYLSRKYEKVNPMLKKRWVEVSNWIFNFQQKKKAFNKLPSNQIIFANGSFLGWILMDFFSLFVLQNWSSESNRMVVCNQLPFAYILSHLFKYER